MPTLLHAAQMTKLAYAVSGIAFFYIYVCVYILYNYRSLTLPTEIRK